MKRVQRLSLALLSVSILLWSLSLATAELKIGDYGLIHSLSPLYFLSLLLLTASFLVLLKSRPDSSILLGFHLLTFALFMSLTPIILEQTPRYIYTYANLGYAGTIISSGHIDAAGFPYLNWPGVHLLNAELIMVSGIKPLDLTLWYPLIAQLMMVSVAALLFRNLCRGSWEFWVALWLSILYPILPGYPLLTSNLAYLMFMVILAILLSRWSKTRAINLGESGYAVAIIILLMATVITHLFTSLILLVSLVLFYLVYSLFARRLGGLNLVVLFAVIFLGWLFYSVGAFTATLIPSFVDKMIHLDLLFGWLGETIYSGSEARTVVVYIRFLYVAIITLLALAAFLRSFIWHRDREFHRSIPAAWVAGSVSLAPFYPGLTVLTKAFEASSFWLCAVAARSVRGRVFPVFLAIILFVCPFLFPVWAWGNETVDYVPPDEIAAVDFFYNHRPTGDSTVETLRQRVWTYRIIDGVEVFAEPTYETDYVVGGQSNAATIEFLGWGELKVSEYEERLETPAYNRIYASPHVELSQRR